MISIREITRSSDLDVALDDHHATEIQAENLRQSKSEKRNRITELSQHVLLAMVREDVGTPLERAAYGLALDRSDDLLNNVDHVEEYANEAYAKLAAVDKILRKPGAPFMKFDIKPDRLYVDAYEIDNYTYRTSDGSGLTITEDGYANNIWHRVTVNEQPRDYKYIDGYRTSDLAIKQAGIRQFAELWQHGPELAVDDIEGSLFLDHTHREGRPTTHLLIGREAIHTFFDSNLEGPQIDMLIGSAMRQGFRFRKK